MTNQDTTVIKILSDMGMTEEPTLSPEQEEMLARALDPDEDFLHAVEKLFNTDKSKK